MLLKQIMPKQSVNNFNHESFPINEVSMVAYRLTDRWTTGMPKRGGEEGIGEGVLERAPEGQSQIDMRSLWI